MVGLPADVGHGGQQVYLKAPSLQAALSAAITGAAAPVSVFGRAASHQACMLLVSIFKSVVVSYVCKGTHYFSDYIFNPLPLSRAPPRPYFF